jgi:hypothetical protein
MRDYAAGMKKLGFHILSYFNVTEFGADVSDPPPPRTAADDKDLWRKADDFLYGRLAGAILRVPAAVPDDKLSLYPRSRKGGPYFTWGQGIITDPGEPVYREFLLEQAEKHIRLIPDAGHLHRPPDWLGCTTRATTGSWFAARPGRFVSGDPGRLGR